MKVSLLIVLTLAASFAVPAQITVYLAGDSTCANKAENKRPETGWGERLQQYFDPVPFSVSQKPSGRTF